MTAAARQLELDLYPPSLVLVSAEVETPEARAERLVFSIATAFMQLRNAIGRRAKARLDDVRRTALNEIAELRALCGVELVRLPAPPHERRLGRCVRTGCVPPDDATQDAAALAVWAVLGPRWEDCVTGWRRELSREVHVHARTMRAERAV